MCLIATRRELLCNPGDRESALCVIVAQGGCLVGLFGVLSEVMSRVSLYFAMPGNLG